MHWRDLKYLVLLACSLASPAMAQDPAGVPFVNPLTGQLHKFVAANYTDLGVDREGNMPSDEGSLKANATEDLNRLQGLGVTNVRIWAFLGYNPDEYGKMANRVRWLAALAQARGMTLTVDLFDSSGSNSLQDLLNSDAHITRMINNVIPPNANKSHIYWSLGNEIGGYENLNGFVDYYLQKVNLMRQKGALKISFQPVPGSLEHRWGGDTTQAATRVIDASDDISVHFYAKGPRSEESTVNWLEFTSAKQWIRLAHSRCKVATLGEFGIDPLGQRTDANVAEWLAYWRDHLKVDQVSFWQFTKNEGGHTDARCFCEIHPPGNGSHISGMAGYLGGVPTNPGSSSCSGGGGNPWKTIASNGSELSVGQSYWSNNGAYRLTMQTDGNLVLYQQNGTAVWHTFTYGNNGARCYMQSDGNLVIYSTSGAPLWHTYTYGNPGASLQISNDGKVRIIRNGVVLWQRP